MFVLPELKPDEILIYLRKSRTDDPALTVSETVAKHEQMLDEYSMRTFGALIPEQNRFREIVSGETIDARPEIKKVLRLIEQDRFKAILIVEPQRLSRGDLEDIGRISKLLRYTRTCVITLQYSYDLTDERDRDYFERELKRGNEYLEYSKRIMRNGIRASVERGDYVGSSAPYGYKIVKIKDGKRYAHTLEIVPDEAVTVKMIFQMYADGSGATAIANTLNRLGIPAARSAYWRQDSIYAILDNVHYIGKIKWNTRKQTISVVDGDIRKSRPRSEPEVFDGKHPAIIESDLWKDVRKRRADRSTPKVRSSFDIQNPLAGLLYCECGRAMNQNVPKGKSRRFFCTNQPICGNAGCTNDIIMRMVSDSIRQEIENIHITISDSHDSETSEYQIRMLQANLDSLKAKQDAIWEKYAEGMPDDTFHRLISKNEQDIADCARALSVALSESHSTEYLQGTESSLYAALAAIEEASSPVKETNMLLKSVIRRITYRRSRARKAEGADRGNRGGWITSEPEISIEYRI